jgi:S1-C subfamily serine protease
MVKNILKYWFIGIVIGIFIFCGCNVIKNNLVMFNILQQQIDGLQDQCNQLVRNDVDSLQNNIDTQKLINGSVFVRGIRGLGTGTVIKKSENRMYILTCYHVVEDIIEVNQMGLDIGATIGYSKNEDESNEIIGMITYKANILKYDKEVDLALLEVKTVDDTLEEIPIADKEPQKGDIVYSVGNPKGLLRTISKGILSNKLEGFYFSDNTTTYGNSGGGLFNSNGELIGVPSNVMGYEVGKDMFVPESSLGLSRDLYTIKSFLRGLDI